MALESQMQQTNMYVLTSATEPSLPSRPRLLLNTAVGAVFGLLLRMLVPRRVFWMVYFGASALTTSVLSAAFPGALGALIATAESSSETPNKIKILRCKLPEL